MPRSMANPAAAEARGPGKVQERRSWPFFISPLRPCGQSGLPGVGRRQVVAPFAPRSSAGMVDEHADNQRQKQNAEWHKEAHGCSPH